MSIADQITRLQTAKSAIKTSIENKGVTVPADTKIDAYPTLIDSIQTSGVSYTYPDYFMVKTQNNTYYTYVFNVVKDFGPIDVENMDTSKVTKFDRAFDSCVYAFDNKKVWNFSNWDVSKGENFSSMFYNAGPSTAKTRVGSELHIDGWTFNTTGAIQSMFNSCRFEKIYFTNCNFLKQLSSTTNVFQAVSATEIDVTGTDFSSFKYFTEFFKNSTGLTKITGDIDLSNAIQTFNYSSESYGMFYNCRKLTSVHLKNIYKNTTLTNDKKHSIYLNTTALTDECLIEIISELPDLINDKGLTATDQLFISLPTTNTLTEEQVKVATDKGWTVTNTTY